MVFGGRENEVFGGRGNETLLSVNCPSGEVREFGHNRI